MKQLGTERYSKSRWKYGDTVAFAAVKSLEVV